MKLIFACAVAVAALGVSNAQPILDKGIECVVEAQKWDVAIVVASDTSTEDALLSFANEHGIAISNAMNVAYAIGTADFIQTQDTKGFFARRETAYKRAASQAEEKLSNAFKRLEFDDGAGEKASVCSSFVILQAEGMNHDTGKYGVAVLSIRSPGLDSFVRDVCSGSAVAKIDVTGESISEWAARTRGLLCGSRLLFDQEGCAWLIGGSSRGLANPKSSNAASLRSRGLSEMFAKQMAIQAVVGKDFENLKVQGMRGVASGAEKDDFTGAYRCYCVYGVPANNVATACRLSLENVAQRRKEVEEAARRVAAKEVSGESVVDSEKMPPSVDPPDVNPEQLVKAAMTDDTNTNASAEIAVAKDKSREEASPQSQDDDAQSDFKKLVAEEECSDIVLPPAEKAIRDLCNRQKWCIGWDVENARIIQIGLAEFNVDGVSSRRDAAFFEKREDAVRRAIAEAMLKISCQLSFDVSDSSDGKTVVTIEGASLMTMSEGFNPNTGNYQVAVLLTWSKAFEKAARFTMAGKSYAMPLGKDSVRDWIAGLNPTMLVGSRKYIDYKGNCWLVGTTVFRWSDTLLMDERSRRMDRALAFAKEMLALGCHAEIVIDRSDYDLLMSEFRSLSKESVINRVLSELKFTVNSPVDRIRGEIELLDKMEKHPATGERVRVIVYGLTANLAANTKK